MHGACDSRLVRGCGTGASTTEPEQKRAGMEAFGWLQRSCMNMRW